jgi:uncharacterized oxidoreductase
MNWTGNTILITGGGTGIGRGLAESFHAMGNDVIIAGRRVEPLQETVAANPGMSYLTFDQDSAKSIQELAAQVAREHAAVNVLVNNAGIQLPENVLSGEIVDAEKMVVTNLLGPIRLTAALLPLLLKQPRAAILNVSSGLAFVPRAFTPTYCATKAALHSYTESLRFQLRESSVQVLELIPPWVQTGLQGDRSNDPRAMPLKQFIAETLQLLKSFPDAAEIVVERAQPVRTAERNGSYDALFTMINTG